MRFRPLGPTGMAVSAISLKLSDNPARNTAAAWVPLIYSAFENGVNAFELVGRQPALIEGFAQAVRAVERRLLFVALRLGQANPAAGVGRDFSADGVLLALESFLARCPIGYVDAVVLDDPDAEELSSRALDGLRAMREAGRARMLGIAGDRPAIETHIASSAFDLVLTPFNLASGWKDRQRLKAATTRDMAVIGYDYWPDQIRQGVAVSSRKAPPRKGKAPLAGAGSYQFLHQTRNWASEEICLAFALTEPSLASVQIVPDRPEQIEALSQVTERDLPVGVAAQIEMARFTPDAKAPQARRA
jgi:aryl-alcohol dehydrogenase-like predicted oxidoreductase